MVLVVGALHLRVALPVVGGGEELPDPEPLPDLDPEPLLDPDPEPVLDPEPLVDVATLLDPEPLLDAPLDPEPLPDELPDADDPEELPGVLAGPELDPDVPVAANVALVAAAAGESADPLPPPQPDRTSAAATTPQSVLNRRIGLLPAGASVTPQLGRGDKRLSPAVPCSRQTSCQYL